MNDINDFYDKSMWITYFFMMWFTNDNVMFFDLQKKLFNWQFILKRFFYENCESIFCDL